MKHKVKTMALILGMIILAGCSASPKETTPGNEENGGTPSDIISTEVPDSPQVTDIPDTKEIVFEIEGTQETMLLTKFQGENFYIYYDAENFKAEDDGDKGVSFLLNNSDPTKYPDVSMTVSYAKGVTSAQKKDELLSGEASDYSLIDEKSIGGLPAVQYHSIADADPQWNSLTSDFYLIESEDGCFVITISSYLEAAEGWGARLGAMVDTFMPVQ
jgi:hypothetical protein